MSNIESTNAFISVPEGLPGIIGPMKAYPDTAKPLNELADLLLSHETPTFPKKERETIAAYVSFLNHCVFCSESHGAVADYHWGQIGFSRDLWSDLDKAPVSERLRALLRLAGKVQKTPSEALQSDVDLALKLGATQRDVHDTVLIAAAFCMYNRYVDGLGTFAFPRGHAAYNEMGKMLGEQGYSNALEKHFSAPNE